MKKLLISVGLLAVIAVLVYWLYSLFSTPIEFAAEREHRETAVIQKLKDIRTLQRSYRTKYGTFAGTFNDLIGFYKNDSLIMEMAVGSADDSVAMAQGKVFSKKYNVAVKDTVLSNNYDIDQIASIPFSEKATGSIQTFVMDTISIKTESSVRVPVFEAFAPYKSFLGDLNTQELVNYRDLRVNTLMKDDGLKVGSLMQANNEAGNWE